MEGLEQTDGLRDRKNEPPPGSLNDLHKTADSAERLGGTSLERFGQLEGFRYPEVFKAIVEHGMNSKEGKEDGKRIAIVIDGGGMKGAEAAGALMALASNHMLNDGILCGSSVGAMIALTAASANEKGENHSKVHELRSMFATLAKDPTFVNQSGMPALIWKAIEARIGLNAVPFLNPARAIELAMGRGVSMNVSQDFTVIMQAARANPKSGEETIVHLAPSTRSVNMAETALASASLPFPVAKTHTMSGEMYVEGGGKQPIDAEFADGGSIFSITKMLKNLPPDKRPTHVLVFSCDKKIDSNSIMHKAEGQVRNFIMGEFNPELQKLYSPQTEERLRHEDAEALKGLGIPFAVISNASEIRKVTDNGIVTDGAVGNFDTDPSKIKNAGMQMFARMIDTLEQFSGEKLKYSSVSKDAVKTKTLH